MSEDNLILKMAMEMSNELTLENGIEDNLNTLLGSLENKYLTKANDLIESHKINAKKSLSNEISLLNSIKPFLKKNNYESIDSAINMMTLLSVATNMSNEMKSAYPIITATNKNMNNKENYDDSSIHKDGIYDYNQEPNKTNTLPNSMFPILVMMFSQLRKSV